MDNPPEEMVKLTHQLSEAIRSPHSRNKSSEQVLSACRYGEFIRDNVFAVVTNTFPLFCEQLSHNELNQFVDEFVETHSANEPEFHHIATEFVKFVASIIQQIALSEELPFSLRTLTNNGFSEHKLTQQLVPLLEYEWATFCVEIDEPTSQVIKSERSYKASRDQTLMENCDLEKCSEQLSLSVNPTVRLLNLPFVVHADTVTFLTRRRSSLYYAVYRDTSQHVMTLALKEIDVAVIQMIQQAELQSLATLKNNIAQQAASFDFINWIEQFCKLGLLNVQPLGEI